MKIAYSQGSVVFDGVNFPHQKGTVKSINKGSAYPLIVMGFRPDPVCYTYEGCISIDAARTLSHRPYEFNHPEGVKSEQVEAAKDLMNRAYERVKTLERDNKELKSLNQEAAKTIEELIKEKDFNKDCSRTDSNEKYRDDAREALFGQSGRFHEAIRRKVIIDAHMDKLYILVPHLLSGVIGVEFKKGVTIKGVVNRAFDIAEGVISVAKERRDIMEGKGPIVKDSDFQDQQP